MGSTNRTDHNNPYQRRLNLLFTLIFLSLATLILRLTFIQVVKGDYYRTKAEETITTKISTPAPRGVIYDRNLQPLVTNEPSYSVQYTAIGDQSQDPNAIAGKLAPFLKQPNETLQQTDDRLVKKMKDTDQSSASQSYLAENVTPQTVAYVSEHLDELPGINIVVIPLRKYTNDSYGSHILGYLHSIPSEKWPTYQSKGYQPTDLIGQYGIEKYYESDLRGQDGTQTVEVNRNYQPINTVQSSSPVPGHDLVLNIDTPLQKVLDDALAQQVKSLQSKYPKQGIKNAAAVAIDPNTGDVLAMGSYPEFNPNVWASGEISGADYQQFAPAEYNQALQATFAPGSTVKPITVMAGLKAGVITPQTQFYDPGYLTIGNSIMWNWNHSGDGWVNAERGLSRSNNTFMGNVMLALGNYPPKNESIYQWQQNELPKTIDLLHNYHQQMGLGVPTGIDLPEEVTGTWNFDGTLSSLPFMGIGQNMTDTATELAQYCGMLANGGKRMELHVVHQVLADNRAAKPGEPTEKVIQTVQPKVLNTMPFTQDQLGVVWKGMWDVVHNQEGTASPAFIGAPYDVRAKTGTSQLTNDIENDLFIGFMPADHPTIAISVIIPNLPAGLHSYETIGPIARKIMDEWWTESHGNPLPRPAQTPAAVDQVPGN